MRSQKHRKAIVNEFRLANLKSDVAVDEVAVGHDVRLVATGRERVRPTEALRVGAGDEGDEEERGDPHLRGREQNKSNHKIINWSTSTLPQCCCCCCCCCCSQETYSVNIDFVLKWSIFELQLVPYKRLIVSKCPRKHRKEIVKEAESKRNQAIKSSTDPLPRYLSAAAAAAAAAVAVARVRFGTDDRTGRSAFYIGRTALSTSEAGECLSSSGSVHPSRRFCRGLELNESLWKKKGSIRGTAINRAAGLSNSRAHNGPAPSDIFLFWCQSFINRVLLVDEAVPPSKPNGNTTASDLLSEKEPIAKWIGGGGVEIYVIFFYITDPSICWYHRWHSDSRFKKEW